MSDHDEQHRSEGHADDGDGREGGSILDDGGIDTDERAGRSQGIDPAAEPDEETRSEMEEEREQRLDPDNRPDGAEVDNTDRDFDVEKGMFTDNESFEDADPAYVDPEDPNRDEQDETSEEES